MENAIGLFAYAVAAFLTWKLRGMVNRDGLERAGRGKPENIWAIQFISAVFWPIMLPVMTLGVIQRRFMRPASPVGQRKPKSQRGKR